MKLLLKITKNKLALIAIVYLATMFMPWREIYKGESVFTVLPMWWEYGNPINNYLSIGAHILISLIIGILIYVILKQIKTKLDGNVNKNT
jgi:hypothetical protein